MRFTDIELEELDTNLGNGVYDGSYNVSATDELIDWMNEIRMKQGNTDIVSVNNDNDVYYNYYLYFRPHNKEIRLWGQCNNGEEDDYVDYEIELTDEEKEMLMWKVIEQLLKELD